MAFFTYILASRRNGTLYIGSTDDLTRRVWEHQEGAGSAFAAKHGVRLLVYFEQHDTRHGAFIRERQMKEWRRAWKLELIERFNPGWRDLAQDFEA